MSEIEKHKLLLFSLSISEKYSDLREELSKLDSSELSALAELISLRVNTSNPPLIQITKNYESHLW